MPDWRTVQLFLSPRHPAIYEVELDLDNADARCSCPTYRARSKCRHTTAVQSRMQDSNGQYPIMFQHNVTDEAISDCLDDPVAFRDYVVRFGKVEVL
jgi:hypothetical protein